MTMKKLKNNKLFKIIYSYNMNFNIKKNIVIYLLMIIMSYYISSAFNLSNSLTLLLIVIMLLEAIYVLKALITYSTNEIDYSNYVNFLQHFIGVYKINQKTLYCLNESLPICNDELKSLVEVIINTINSGENIKDSLFLLLKYNNHFIVYNLINMISSIESYGSFEFKEGLELISDDIDDWIEDTYDYKLQVIKNKNKVTILCGFAIFIGLVAKGMLTQIGFDLNNRIYQISVFLFMLSIILTLFLSYKHLNNNWIDKEEVI